MVVARVRPRKNVAGTTKKRIDTRDSVEQVRLRLEFRRGKRARTSSGLAAKILEADVRTVVDVFLFVYFFVCNFASLNFSGRRYFAE